MDRVHAAIAAPPFQTGKQKRRRVLRHSGCQQLCPACVCVLQTVLQQLVCKAPVRLRLRCFLRFAALHQPCKRQLFYFPVRSSGQACQLAILCQLRPAAPLPVQYDGRLRLSAVDRIDGQIQVAFRTDFNEPPQIAAHDRRAFKLPRDRAALLQLLQADFIRRPDLLVIHHHKRVAHAKKMLRAQFGRQHDQRSDREPAPLHFLCLLYLLYFCTAFSLTAWPS